MRVYCKYGCTLDGLTMHGGLYYDLPDATAKKIVELELGFNATEENTHEEPPAPEPEHKEDGSELARIAREAYDKEKTDYQVEFMKDRLGGSDAAELAEQEKFAVRLAEQADVLSSLKGEDKIDIEIGKVEP